VVAAGDSGLLAPLTPRTPGARRIAAVD